MVVYPNKLFDDKPEAKLTFFAISLFKIYLQAL